MYRNLLLSACGLLLAAISHGAYALTLDEALRLAENHSPLLAAAVAQEQGAKAALDTATAYPNPELELAGGSYRPRQPGAASGHAEAVGLSQPVELFGVRGARRQMAEAGLNAGSAVLQQARLDLRSRVKLAYYDVLRRLGEAKLATESRVLLEQIRDRVKLKVEVGESPRYELVKAEAEALSAANAARSAELRVIQAKTALKALIGAPLPDGFTVVAEELPSSPLPDLESLQREMRERQPQLKAAEAETRKAQARVEMERSLRLPQPTLKWTSERDPESRLWRFGVALPLPLWNRRDGPIGEAVAGMHQAEAEARRVQLGLEAELDQAYARYEIAKRQVEVFESGLLKEAESALKVAEAAYRYGERSILDYLDAQRVLRATRLDFLNARYELQAAWVEIERLRALPGEL
ncbi:MAG: TolC family protein [Sulfuricellaceae bacterium]|jgi:cobalt-zinc-cadmium efflux system outer membrane protein